MPEPVALPEQTTPLLDRVGAAELVVGVVTCNHAATVAEVVTTAWTALERGFPGTRAAVVHADYGSQDGTLQRAAGALDPGALVQVPNVGGPGTRAEALRAVFAATSRLGARGCAVIDGDVTGIAPDWAARLLAPVASDTADYVVSLVSRGRYDGALTTGVVYPLLRALYGKQVRQPVGGEFACSHRLVPRYLASDLRQPGLGLDAWLAVQALAGGYRVAQAALGPRAQPRTAESGSLTQMLTRVLGAVFLEIERTVSVWQKVQRSAPVPLIGEASPAEADGPMPDLGWALESFRIGERNLRQIWGAVLPPLTLMELRKAAAQADGALVIADRLWSRIVYDFVLGYHLKVMNRDHLLAAFAPLYAGWLASFVGEVRHVTAAEVDGRVERLCQQFEAEKPYLIARWRWPDRFAP
jgi:hypothetical protein